MATEIDQLQIEITDNSESAVKSLDALVNTLGRLKTIAKGGAGLTATSNQLRKLNEALATMNMPSEKIRNVVESLKPLSGISKATGLNSTINSLKKLPELTKSLEAVDMDKFAGEIKRVTAALVPLGTEMQKISNGFNAFPTKIQKIISQNERLATSNRRTGRSFSVFGSGLSGTLAKLGIYYLALKRVGGVLGGWVNSANEYIENINLFTVSMGKYAEESMNYAKAVNEAMGIDLSEFIRNQGIFMQIATGFGVVEEQAYKMSRGLTQVSYDIASFFNIPIEQAFMKVQSGISGELEPLRRLGYALDQATLEQIALNNGVQTSVTKMNQAQKSYLRYIAIMQQSTNVTGDMARTLITPANATRILSQQMTQLTRALGNMFIPMLIKVIPYVQAFVMVLTQAAQALANLLGFELPTIDYSSVGGLSSAIDDVDGGLTDATNNAKKLKSILAGFDELNILQTKEASAGSAVSGLDASGLGIDLGKFDYDFLGEAENQAKKIFENITEKIEEVKKKLEPYEPLLEGIAAGFLTAFGMKWVAGAVSKFGKVGTITTGLGFLKDGLKYARDAFILTKNPLLALGQGFGALWLNFKIFVQGLSPFTKAALALIGLATEFKVTKDAVKEFALGNENFIDTLLRIGPTIAIVEAVLLAAFGPTGAIIGGFVAVAAAIVGFNEAQQELQQKWIAETFFDGVGVSLDELKQSFIDSKREMQLQNEQIIAWGEEIKNNNAQIDKTLLSIQTLSATLGSEGVVTQTEIDKIKNQFSSLYESVRRNMELSDQVITTALVGALQRATPKIKGEIDVLLGEYMRLSRQTEDRMTVLEGLMNSSLDSLVGLEVGSPQYKSIMNSLNDYTAEYVSLTREISTVSLKWDETVKNINNTKINFGTVDGDMSKSVENLKSNLGEIAGVGIDFLKDLEAAHYTYLSEVQGKIEHALKYGTIDDVNYYKSLRTALQTDYKTQRENIFSDMQMMFNEIQVQMVQEAIAVKERASLEWSNLNWFEKVARGGSEAAYVNQALIDFRNNLILPVQAGIQTNMSELGFEGSIWAAEAMDEILKTMFHVDFSNNSMEVVFTSSVEDAVKRSLDNIALSGKADAIRTGSQINAGLSLGISGSIPEVDKAIMNTANSAIEQWKATTETRSPSQIFENLGAFIPQGLVIGIDSGANGVVKSIKGIGTSIIDEMTRIVTSISNSVSTVLTSISSAKTAVESLNSIKITAPALQPSALRLPPNSIKQYATGGFPQTGQLFVAREAGVEMVGNMGGRPAVANNDQIVDGISKGVYDAMVTALSSMGQSNRSSNDDNSEFVLVIDDIQFGRVVTKSINNAQRQTGTSMLTV